MLPYWIPGRDVRHAGICRLSIKIRMATRKAHRHRSRCKYRWLFAQNTDLSPEGIARRREALGRQALSELENWPPLGAAERAITENIEFLEKKMSDLPQSPTAIADVMLAQEIRQHIRRQKSRIDVAMRSVSDPRMLGAILRLRRACPA